MTSRRSFLKTGLLGASAVALHPRSLCATHSIEDAAAPPTRFIFMHKGNGLLPQSMVPPSFSPAEMKEEKRKQAFDLDLAGHELPGWLQPLNAHLDQLTLLQGLSGKMCTTGHHSWCSSLGVFKANERLSSIKWATVDFELAKLFPSPFEHIEFACFPHGGGNARGNVNGIEKGFSARGAQQPNYAFGSPKVAMQELFKSVSNNEKDRTRYELERKLLEFAAGGEGGIAKDLSGLERAKIQNYAESIEAIRKRNRKVDAMADVIRKNAPRLDPKFFADDLTTIDRQEGLAEILLATLIAGMTNVVAFTVDELGTRYTGIPGIEKERVNLHDVGHGKPAGGVKALEVRDRVRHQHARLIDKIVSRLKAVPEGDGAMFDNTMLCYFPDSGETHHSRGTEYPFVVLAGKNTKLKIARRYIRLPKYGVQGHRTLGNWYTTILNAYGNDIEHYGALDAGLDKLRVAQQGPIPQFLA